MYIIDRFEGNWAIIESSNKTTFSIPIELVSKGAKEGSVIILKVIIDQEATDICSISINKTLNDFFNK